jgi:hypothetical protein
MVPAAAAKASEKESGSEPSAEETGRTRALPQTLFDISFGRRAQPRSPAAA